MTRRHAVLALGVAALTAAAGCGGSSSGGADTVRPQTTGSSASPSAAAAGCTTAQPETKQPQQFGKEPAVTIARTRYTARMTTNCGRIVIAMDGKHAPHTVNSFAFLAKKHYFDGTPCHRLTTAGIYVLQCGDPTGSGSGGPGYQFRDENLRGATYRAGTVAMANAGPNTNGSQFFLVYQDTQLPPSYTPFGRIVSGLDVVRKIAAAGTDNANGAGDGHPLQPVVITTFTVTKGR